MRFISNEDGNLYSRGDEENFSFPTNVKQIGCLDDSIKIYVEDYVHTYLYQYGRSGAGKEKLAVLVGREMIVDGHQLVIISGAIQAKYSEVKNGVETFSAKSWEYIQNQMDVYFKGLVIVGWMHSQPSFGAFLMAKDEMFHKENFEEPWHIFFVLDPVEKQDNFYILNENKTAMRPVKGYFIYYDKNRNMQDYMIDNTVIKPKLPSEEEYKEDVVASERLDAAKKIRTVLNRKNEEEEQKAKKRYTMLIGMSCILFFAFIAIGAGLIHSQDRLRKVENELAAVMDSYDTLTATIEETAVKAVFAAEEKIAQNREEETTAVDKPAEAAKQESDTGELKKSETGKKTDEEVSAVKQNVNTYIVEEGDNLGYISVKFYGTRDMIERIMELNGITDPNTIYVGEVLELPEP